MVFTHLSQVYGQQVQPHLRCGLRFQELAQEVTPLLHRVEDLCTRALRLESQCLLVKHVVVMHREEADGLGGQEWVSILTPSV